MYEGETVGAASPSLINNAALSPTQLYSYIGNVTLFFGKGSKIYILKRKGRVSDQQRYIDLKVGRVDWISYRINNPTPRMLQGFPVQHADSSPVVDSRHYKFPK